MIDAAEKYLKKFKLNGDKGELRKDQLVFMLNDFGKIVWEEAQKSANDFRINNFKNSGKYPACTITPYKI